MILKIERRSKMYTSDEKYEVILNSAADINMSMMCLKDIYLQILKGEI